MRCTGHKIGVTQRIFTLNDTLSIKIVFFLSLSLSSPLLSSLSNPKIFGSTHHPIFNHNWSQKLKPFWVLIIFAQFTNNRERKKKQGTQKETNPKVQIFLRYRWPTWKKLDLMSGVSIMFFYFQNFDLVACSSAIKFRIFSLPSFFRYFLLFITCECYEYGFL